MMATEFHVTVTPGQAYKSDEWGNLLWAEEWEHTQWGWAQVDRAALRWWVDLTPKKRTWYLEHPYTAVKWSQWFQHISYLMNLGPPLPPPVGWEEMWG